MKSKYFSPIYKDFWTDNKVLEQMDFFTKYIFLYCLSNPAVNPAGVFEFSMKTVELHTAVKSDEIIKSLDLLEKLKVIEIDPQTKEIAIVNYGKRNWLANKNLKTQAKAVVKAIDEIKSPTLKGNALKTFYKVYGILYQKDEITKCRLCAEPLVARQCPKCSAIYNEHNEIENIFTVLEFLRS